MNKIKKSYLLLEQLEERIFLDANPVAAADTDVAVDGMGDPLTADADLQHDLESATDTVSSGSESASQAESESQDEVDAATREADENDAGGPGESSQSASETDRAADDPGDEGDPAPEEAAAEADADGEDPSAQDPPDESESIIEEPDSATQAEETAAPSRTAADGDPSQSDESGPESDGQSSGAGGGSAEDAPQADESQSSAAEPQTNGPEADEAENGNVPGAEGTAIDPMIGEEFQFTVTLDNDSGATLYGPYIDLYLPSSGDDGDGDGVSFVEATYLGTPVNATVQTFDASQEIEHPYAVDAAGNPLTISGTEGDTYVTLEMPFGSFTPDQPAAEVEVTALIDENRAVDGGGGSAQDFDIEVYNGYRFGSDPLNNPAADTPDPPAMVDTQTFRPEVIRFEKEYIGPEQESASGPNYPRQYQIAIDIADGQTIENLQLTENLPNEIYYLGDATVSVSGGRAFTVTSPNAAGGIFTDGVLDVVLTDAVTGTAAADDVVITFDFYVPQFYGDGATPILDPGSGDDALGGTEDREVINDVQVRGDWTPTDTDDAPVTIVMDAEVDSEGIISPTPGEDEVFDAEAIAIQKAVSIAEDTGVAPDADGEGGYNPGDVVRFTLEFQISDYFNFGDIVVNDLLPDGLQFYSSSDPGASDYLTYDAAYVPTFAIQDETGSWSGAWNMGADLIPTENPGGENNLNLAFDVSAAIVAQGDGDGILQGDLYDDASAGTPATGTITYYALIKDEYLSSGAGDSSGPGDVSIDQGDILVNRAEIEGQIYGDDGSGGLTAAGFELDQDDTSASIQIEVGAVRKEVYAINGNTDLTLFTDAQGRLHMQPGDQVTYRLQYYMPTSEFESFRMDDYLPLPVFNAAELTPETDTVIGGVTQDTTPPPAASWYFHPDDTFADNFGAEPIDLVINTLNGENRISFVYDEHDDVAPQESLIDILFTVTVNDDPFADGLYLTNQVRGTEDGTPLVASDTDAIVQIVLDQPELSITKGVVETDNDVPDSTSPSFSANADVDDNFTEPGTPGSRLDGVTLSSQWLAANDIDTNLSNIDAGDTVTFAIVVENTGHFGAFDVSIADTLPAGFILSGSGLNLSVTDGAGNALAYTGDLFTTGIELTDDGDGAINAAGTENAADDDTGSNVLIITYDLVAAAGVAPLQQISNTATLAQYTNYDGADPADNHVPEGLRDDAQVTISAPVVDKNLIGTNQDHTAGREVAIGEEIEYQIDIVVPEVSASNFVLTDNLTPWPAQGQRLSIVSLDSLTASADLSSSSGTLDDSYLSGGNTTIIGSGSGFRIDFGDLTNSNTNNAVDETITVTFTAVVINTADTNQGDAANNRASLTWDENPGDPILNFAQQVTLVEPVLDVGKSVDTPNPDEGDTVTFTVVVAHGAGSAADAFDVNLSDTLPGGYENVAIVIQTGTGSLGGVSDAVSVAGNTLSGVWDVFEISDTYTVVFSADLVSDPQAGADLTNTAAIDWTSLPEDGDPNERSGTPAPGDPDDYVDSASATVTVAGTIDKIDPDPASYTIGDEVQYYMVVTLPEGETENLVVTDNLPAGMQYVSGSHELFTTVAADPSGQLGNDFSGGSFSLISVSGGTADGEAVSFSYGDFSIAADNDPAGENDAFVIGFRALVTDISGNTGDPDGAGPLEATLLVNEAALNYTDPGGETVTVTDPDLPEVTVIEPQITTDKRVADSADAGSDASPGETLTYTARFTNSGDATAYEVSALDTLASGTRFEALLSANDQDGNDLSGTTSMTDNLDGTVTISGDWDIAVDDWVEIQYTVTVLSAGFTAGSYTNTVDADWTSQDGDDPNERTYDDSGTSPLDGDLDDDDATFEVIASAALGDTVFFDSDADGQPQEAGEPGISGVDVTISADVDGDGTPEFTQTVRTDADGTYRFENLAAFDNYVVTVDPDTAGGVDPTSLSDFGYSQTYDLDEDGSPALDHTASGISLALGEDRSDVDFGYSGQNSVGDTVWFDLDSDGEIDPGEDGIGGLEVTLTADIDGDGDLDYTVTTTTDGDGQYSFDNLPAGDYTVTVTPPAGSSPTYDQDNGTAADGIPGDPDHATPFSLGPDEDRDDIDFGLIGTGSLGDFVWFDADANGVQNEGLDAGLGGVTVTLNGDIDGDGEIDYTATAITADDGSYSFDNLFYMPDNAYTVTVDPATLPEGMAPTADLDDPDPDTILTPNTATGSLPEPAAPGDAPENLDFDFGYSGSGSLGDRVWYDLDADGAQDAGETGLAGVEVSIRVDLDGDGTDEYTDTVTTGVDGLYTFDNLPAGEYTVTVNTATLPEGAVPTYDLDSGTTVPDNTDTYSLSAGETTDRVDFGYTGPGAIGDTVWNDIDGDGVEDPGESGFAGVTVTLTGDLNNDGDTSDPEDTLTTTTAADGTYRFDNLFLGDYTVSIDPASLPPGNSPTYDLDDPSGAPFTTPNSAEVTLTAPAPVREDVDFGYNSQGTIGDTVWYDADADGVQDADEVGLAGVTVILTGDLNNDGDTTDPEDTLTTLTDDSGRYLFDQLAAGPYTIAVDPGTLPGGMTQTADPDGVLDNSSLVTLAPGGVDLNQDFGYTGTGTIGDTIWSDADGDGVEDPGESGLAGVTVTLTGDLNNDGDTSDPEDTLTTTTAADGTYSFDNLAAGDYTIVVDETSLPPGVVQTGDPDGTLDSSSDVSLAPGEANLDQDFGYQQTGTIGDTVWYDLDADGVQDPDELGLASVNVTLVGNLDDDPELETLTVATDANGNYLFDQLPAGDYTIIVEADTLPDGMLPTYDLDGTGSADIATVTLGDNEANLDVDFGYTGTGTIGDTIWYDFDGDGIVDPNEAGIPGVTLTLTGDLDNDGTADDTLTVTTDENGTYRFPNLPAGDFTIAVDAGDLPGGMIPSGDPDGSLDNVTQVPLAAGETNLDQDFGYTGTGSVGDQLWNDQNGNGLRDPGEPGLPGVEITIGVDLDGDGTPDFTTSATTDASGGYIFDNLPAGSHLVSVDPATLPPGIRPSFDPDGVLDNRFRVDLGPGETIDSVDFGYRYPPPPIPPPPVIPPPLTVAPPLPPAAPEPAGLVADAFFMNRQFGDTLDVEFPWDRDLEIRYPLPPLPVSPIYTGMAEPGTTLFLTLYDHTGNEVGFQTVMADAAGNWLANFPATLFFDMPHHMAVEQTASSYNSSSPGLFNTRTYFNPNFSSLIFARNILDVEAVFAYMPTTVMNSMHESNHTLFNLEWNDFKGYEFFAPSINPAKLGH